MTIDPKIQEGLEAKRAAVTAAKKTYENAKKRFEALEAELRGWEEVARMMSSANGAAQPEAPTPPVKRRLSDGWTAVLTGMAESYPKDFSLPEIGALCKKHGITAADDTIRGQMHHHAAETKFVERTEQGRFRITDRGANAVGVPLNRHADLDEEIPF